MGMNEPQLPGPVGPAFTAAYLPYLERTLARLDLPMSERVMGAIADGKKWLANELETIDSASPRDLRRGPLEIFQEAMRFPTAALVAEGVAPALRDIAAESALPGDVYALAPASSQDLGESVLEVHVAWGVARARALSGSLPESQPRSDLAVVPRSAVAEPNPLVRESLKVALEAAGYATTLWRNPAEAETSAGTRVIHVAVISGSHPVADALLEVCTREDIPAIVVCEIADDIAQARYLSLGAVRVVGREAFIGGAATMLPRHT